MARLTGPQIAAAMALSKMTQNQLAEAAGVGRNTLNRTIKDSKVTKDDTLVSIRHALESRGIEFLENQGVRFKPSGLEVYEGLERFDDFSDLLYNHLHQLGGEVCVSIYDETLVAKYRKDPAKHRMRMKELTSRGDIKFRVLATKSDFVSHDYVQFKWLPEQSPTPTGFYAFGDCLALMSFVDPRSPYIVVIHSSHLAEAYRQGFEIAWKNAQEPPASKGSGHDQ